MNRLSLRLRLTLWYTLALVVVFALGAADVLWVQGRLGLRRVDRELDATTATLANVIRSELGEGATIAIAAEEARRTVAVPGRAVAVIDAKGRALAATWNGLSLPDGLLGADGDLTSTIDTPSSAWRIHIRREAFDRQDIRVLIGTPLADVRRTARGA